MCVDTTIDDLFVDRADHLVLAFDTLLTAMLNWEPLSFGASKHAVVFTNRTAWLIIKPMSKALDVKFYYDEPIEHDRFHKITQYRKKFAHHLRVKSEYEVDDELLELLRMGYDYGMEQ